MDIKLRSFTNDECNSVIQRYSFSDRFFRLAKEGFWIVFGQAMTVIGTLFGLRVLTELLDPDAYGQLALGMTVAALVNQIVLGPLSNGVARFYSPALAQDDLMGYLNAVLRLVAWATAVIGLIILLTVSGLWIGAQRDWIVIVLAAFAFSIINGYNNILSCILNASRQRSIVALHQGMDAWARFLIAAGLVLILNATSSTVIIGYTLAGSIVFVSQYICFRKATFKWSDDVDKKNDWLNKIWKYSWPFSTWGIFTWAQLASDRWAIGVFSTTEEVGLYTVLFQLGYYPISIVTGIAVQFLAPIFYQKSDDGRDEGRNSEVSKMSWRITWVVLGLTGVTCVLAFLFHAPIFKIFVSKEYASVSYLLPWMMLASGLFSAGQSITLKLMSEMKTQTMMTGKIVTALVGVALNFVGAYMHGIFGVVVSNVLFSFLYLFWMFKIATIRSK